MRPMRQHIPSLTASSIKALLQCLSLGASHSAEVLPMCCIKPLLGRCRGKCAHVGQHATVEVSHDLSNAGAGGLRRPVDYHPRGPKHQRQAVHHVEQPRHPDVCMPQQEPARMQISPVTGCTQCSVHMHPQCWYVSMKTCTIPP